MKFESFYSDELTVWMDVHTRFGNALQQSTIASEILLSSLAKLQQTTKKYINPLRFRLTATEYNVSI